jgi:hypothetical protein
MTSSAAMHDIIARDSSSVSGDAWHHRRRLFFDLRRCMTPPPGINDSIAGDSSSISGDA